MPDIAIERGLKEGGFHRELKTVVHSRSKLKMKGKPPMLLFVETLPPGAFADVHQLRLLDESDAVFAVPDRVDVEKMEHQSQGHRVYAFVALNSSELTVQLPLHLRYHRPQHCQEHGAFATVNLPTPSLYFRHPDTDFPDSCEGLHKLPCGWDQPDQMCTWKALSFNTVDQLTASVPVGCLEDGFLVSTVTLVTYSLCSVAIAYFIFVHGKKQRSD